MAADKKIEEGLDFTPKFGADGLTTAISQDAEPGDVLISIRAPVGPTNLCRERCCIGRGLAALRPRAGMPSSAARAAIAEVFMAPSSSEYSVCRCKWVKGCALKIITFIVLNY